MLAEFFYQCQFIGLVPLFSVVIGRTIRVGQDAFDEVDILSVESFIPSLLEFDQNLLIRSDDCVLCGRGQDFRRQNEETTPANERSHRNFLSRCMSDWARLPSNCEPACRSSIAAGPDQVRDEHFDLVRSHGCSVLHHPQNDLAVFTFGVDVARSERGQVVQADCRRRAASPEFPAVPYFSPRYPASVPTSVGVSMASYEIIVSTIERQRSTPHDSAYALRPPRSWQTMHERWRIAAPSGPASGGVAAVNAADRPRQPVRAPRPGNAKRSSQQMRRCIAWVTKKFAASPGFEEAETGRKTSFRTTRDYRASGSGRIWNFTSLP